MPRKPEIPLLTRRELNALERHRADARSRALEIAETMSDEEDAALIAAAEADPENPPVSDGQFERMRPAHEVVPQLVAAQLRKKGGRPKAAAPKQMVTLRIPPDVLAAYRATGRGWQTRMVETLSRNVSGAAGVSSGGDVKPPEKQRLGK